MGDRTGEFWLGDRVEAFRVHIKPLENRVWHLQTRSFFRSFEKNAAKIHSYGAFQALLALFWTS